MHEGHRARMRERLSSDAKSLQQHELLEILLYNVYPRKNTNEIAHQLLRAFGNLENVLSASVNQLKEIDGVGDVASAYIKTLGLVIGTISNNQAKSKSIVLSNIGQTMEFLSNRYDNLCHEQFDIVLLDINYQLLLCKSFTQNKKDQVGINPREIARIILEHKPHSALIAHNHLSGDTTPSKCDDEATRMISIILSINNVAFNDHIIYSKGKIYSYFLEGRMKEIKTNYSLKVAARDKE